MVDVVEKVCSQCSVLKSLTGFNKKKAARDGYRAQCRTCQSKVNKRYTDSHKQEIKEWHANNYLRNKDKINARNKAYYHSDLEREYKRGKKYREANKESVAANIRNWAIANPDRRRASTAKRRTTKLNATPRWLTEIDHLAIKDKYKYSILLEQETGIKHHIDHIIPLKGKLVCGLHVPDNLRILKESDNLYKGNKFLVK